MEARKLYVVADFQPVIEAGRKLQRKLERIGGNSQDGMSPDDRVTHTEVDQWYNSCISVMDDAFGKGSKELQDFNSSLERVDDFLKLRYGRDPFALLQAERIRAALGIVEQYQARLLGRGEPMQQPLPVNASNPTQNPWVTGSFYLAAFGIILTILVVAALSVNVVVLPLVIVGSLILVSAVGAFQLRNDEKLEEESFLKLMALTFRALPSLLGFGKASSKNA